MRTLRVLGLVTALASACTSFSSGEDDATPDRGAGGGDASVPVASDAGSDSAPAPCSGGCPANSVCDDGTCRLTACSGDGGVVLLRPTVLLDAKGPLETFPATASIVDVVSEHGDGDGDQTYVEGVAPERDDHIIPLALRFGKERFTLPAGRSVESVVIRARARKAVIAGRGTGDSVDGAVVDAKLQLGFVFRSFGGSFTLAAKDVGSAYGLVEFPLSHHPVPARTPPNDASANEWTEARVNDIDVGLDMSVGSSAALRLTQVWVEVCLGPPR